MPLVLGVGLGLVLPLRMLGGTHGNRATFALFLGVAMCVSAIPVIARILLDMRLHNRNVGQLILIAGAVDDAVGWVLLSVVSALATTGVRAGAITITVAKLAGFLLVAVVVGRRVVRLALRWSAGGGAQAVAATAVIVVLASAAATGALGFEPVLGAFVGGVLAGPAARDLAGLRTVVVGVLAPVFFVLAGLRMDLTLLARPRVLLAGLAVLGIAIVGKFAGAYLGARLCRLTRFEALALGAGLNARGVIEVIVATTGVKLGVLNAASYTIVVLVAVVTSLMAPPVLRYAVTRIEHTAEERLR